MNFVRKVADSNILAGVVDIPESLRNKTVEILIFPYENVKTEEHIVRKTERVRGLLKKYQNKNLQKLESEAWAQAVADNNENS